MIDENITSLTFALKGRSRRRSSAAIATGGRSGLSDLTHLFEFRFVHFQSFEMYFFSLSNCLLFSFE